uniref:UV damage repair endonuclease n=1 Tax=viral metagenome TaxID=1070528 RepID=A0A6C0E466_9ZZZZ
MQITLYEMATTPLTDTQKSNLNIGYCCLNMNLRSLGIFTSRTCRLDTIKKLGIEYSYELAEANLKDLAAILRWNYNNGIFLYRMSSEIFPFATHPEYSQNYDLDRFKGLLQKIGGCAKKWGIRLTFHPGQHCVLASSSEKVVFSALCDIDFHAKVMDFMCLDKDGVIVIHGGSKQDGKEAALTRFAQNFSRLTESARERLVIENCEMMYSITDLIPVSRDLGIPIVVDYHHHNINKGDISDNASLQACTEKVLEIWGKREITPLFHLSESKPYVKESDSITARRAHSDYVIRFPDVLLELVETKRIDLDIEAKHKEKAVLYLKKNYY